MSMTTLEWATGLRARLAAEIDTLNARAPDSLAAHRVLALRQQMMQVESLLAALRQEAPVAEASYRHAEHQTRAR